MTVAIGEFTILVWQLLAGLGIALAILEAFVPGFVLLPMGAGLLLSVPFVMKASSMPQIYIVIAAFQIVMFLSFRQVASRRARRGFFTGMDGIVGEIAKVITPLDEQEHGYVRIFGDRWRASTPRGERIGKGEKVKVRGFTGNTLIVTPVK